MTKLSNQFIAERISQLAIQALLYEATLSPKPGLVDALTSGAHTDMDLYTFIDSSISLTPFFTEYILTGLTHYGTPENLFQKIRTIGLLGENEMLRQTNGINTHKGANFSFAFFLSACGKVIQQEESFQLPISEKVMEKIIHYVKNMATGLVHKDFKDLNKKKVLTSGEMLYTAYGFTGIRGEAEAGYPTITKLALPFLRNTKIVNQQHKLLVLLLELMASLEDSNLISRGGMKGWLFVKNEASALLEEQDVLLSEDLLKEHLTCFNNTLIHLNLSPGGAADLLALSIFLGKLEGIL